MGDAAVPLPLSVASCETDAIPAVVCTVPSGNLIPLPEFSISIMPFTVSRDVGNDVPIPILPLLSSRMLESANLLSVNFAIRPGVFGGAAAAGLIVLVEPLCCGRPCTLLDERMNAANKAAEIDLNVLFIILISFTHASADPDEWRLALSPKFLMVTINFLSRGRSSRLPCKGFLRTRPRSTRCKTGIYRLWCKLVVRR